MVFNQLNVRPTEETLSYLSSVMSGSPLDLDLSSYCVEVITTQDEVEANPDNVYDASALTLRPWYDSYLQRSSLILSLDSTDLQRRCLQLNEQGVVREFYNYYNPYLTILQDMPSLSKHYRTFIVQMANVLCANDRPLQFTGEYVTQVDLLAPPNFDYNEAMIAERGNRRNG